MFGKTPECHLTVLDAKSQLRKRLGLAPNEGPLTYAGLLQMVAISEELAQLKLEKLQKETPKGWGSVQTRSDGGGWASLAAGTAEPFKGLVNWKDFHWTNTDWVWTSTLLNLWAREDFPNTGIPPDFGRMHKCLKGNLHVLVWRKPTEAEPEDYYCQVYSRDEYLFWKRFLDDSIPF